MVFLDGSVDKESSCNAGDAGDLGSVPGSRGSHGGGNGNPFQYSGLGNPTDRGAWWARVNGVTKSQTRLSDRMAAARGRRNPNVHQKMNR